MIKDTDLIKVVNRGNGRVGYPIPDSNGLKRLFHAQEEKKIPMEELKKVMYSTGGSYILKNVLVVEDEEAARILFNTDPEPEYFYTEEEVKTLLSTGTLDQLLDCLDFAPEGTVDLVKELAVKTKLNDVSKREAIFKKTGFNVSQAIAINAESEKPEEEEKSVRRAKPISTAESESTPQRRVPTYKVVNK